MNANEIRELRNQLREIQEVINGADNEAAGKMLRQMADSGKPFSGAELSELTDGVLSPSQATSAVRAVCRYSRVDEDGFDYGRGGRRRKPTTKYKVAQEFSNLTLQLDKQNRTSFAIACNEFGEPLEGAQVKTATRKVTTYQLTTDRFASNGNKW